MYTKVNWGGGIWDVVHIGGEGGESTRGGRGQGVYTGNNRGCQNIDPSQENLNDI